MSYNNIIPFEMLQNNFADEREYFIKEIDMKPGDQKVKIVYIYWAYIKWKHKRGDKEVIPKSNFFKGFRDRFPNVRESHQRYYLLDDSPFKIDSAEEELMKEYLKEINDEDRKKRAWEKRRKAIRNGYLKKIAPLLPELRKEKKRLEGLIKGTRKSIRIKKLKLNESLLRCQLRLEKLEKEIEKLSRV